MKSSSKEIGQLEAILQQLKVSDIQCNGMKEISVEYMNQIGLTDPMISGSLYTYDPKGKRIVQEAFQLIPNILLNQGEKEQNYLVLSGCQIIKRVFLVQEKQNQMGSLILIFTQFIAIKKWYQMLKQYCKLHNFNNKFKICECVVPRHFIAMKKKSKALYTVRVLTKNDFEKCKEFQDALQNEIHLLRSVKQQSLLELKRVYEDTKHIYLVFEYFKGETLYKLVSHGLQLDEIQMASVRSKISIFFSS